MLKHADLDGFSIYIQKEQSVTTQLSGSPGFKSAFEGLKCSFISNLNNNLGCAM